jgi:hypothetical protein
MIRQPPIYDLTNLQTPEMRRIHMEQNIKKIQQRAENPTIVELKKNDSTFANPGTPAYAMSIKQRQQTMNYGVNEFPQSQQM